MNKKLTKLRETSGHVEDRHPSQNDLPPIDKFHPDWWYYRQEMEEPIEMENESRYMNKKLIRLTESDLHKIVKESVNRVLKEANFRGERLHGNNPEDWEALTSLRNNLDTYGEYSPGSMTPKEKEKHHKAWKRNYRNFDSLTDKIDDELGQKPLSPEYDERYQKYADQSSKKYHNMRKNLGLPEFYH